MLKVLTAVQHGENYRLFEVENAIAYLTHATRLHCPLETSFSNALGNALAKEILAALIHKP